MACVLYVTRRYWLPTWRAFAARYLNRQQYSFLADQDAGLSSLNFDLSTNIASGDARQGLDASAKKEIQRLMRQRGIDFDEAREIFTKQRFSEHGIGPDGRPLDPKAVFFS
ncbi:hypothetical protein TRVA0_052S01024 [Trichomonascus vanleenenianus]|uniref:uncharacterized protein n=1 Tax=Trichomonascus vanleenenianus TaxID=2268995 RepID=UPI003ECB047C